MEAFTLTPRVEGQALAALSRMCQADAAPGQPAVLVVDDEPDVRLLVTLMLRKEYAVYEASGAEEAIRTLAHKHRGDPPEQDISVVLLDVMMPDMDGLTLCRQIKKDFDVPVVVFSARAGPQDREAAMKSGADDYLVKPFSHRMLIDKVARYSGISECGVGGRYAKDPNCR